jgi:hypothetical protein
LNPTAPTLRSFLTSAERGKTPKKLETLIVSVKYTNTNSPTQSKADHYSNKKRDSKKIEAEPDNPSSTSNHSGKKQQNLSRKTKEDNAMICQTPWARYPSKAPSAELASEVSTLITNLEYNKACEQLASNKPPGTDHQLSNQKKRTCRR